MSIPVEAEQQLLDIALHGVTDPEPDLVTVNSGSGDPELKCLQRRASTEEQEFVHKLPDLLEGHRRLPVRADDSQASGRLPEASPAPGEHAGLHGLLRGEEGEDAAEDFVRESADAVAATRRSCSLRSLARFTGRHSGGRGEGA